MESGTAERTRPVSGNLATTGIVGLDTVLGGGLPAGCTYLIQGLPGTGKTTLALQFCMAGAASGESVLYITTSESRNEVHTVAEGHGWSLDGVEIRYHEDGDGAEEDPMQSVFAPAEVELPRAFDTMLAAIRDVRPQRLVIDSLSELRYLAREPVWFRRQLIALKHELAALECTTLLCDDDIGAYQPAQTIVHGVLALEQRGVDYGPDRRRLRVVKLRGQPFSTGFHDFDIHTGGIAVYPRLIAAEHRTEPSAATVSSGLPALDDAFHGTIDSGTAILLLGPAGTGKSSVATRFALAAAERGDRAAMYVFDERIETLLKRTRGLGFELDRHLEQGRIELRQIDPTELTPGAFSHAVREAVERRGVRLVVIDSLAGFFHAMPNERLISLHLHELLSYLSQRGVTSLLVMTQHGLPGRESRTTLDLSYLSDSVILFHIFEFEGELRNAISVLKHRGGGHERGIRELEFGRDGIRVGPVLAEFRGILTGVPARSDSNGYDDVVEPRTGRRATDR